MTSSDHTKVEHAHGNPAHDDQSVPPDVPAGFLLRAFALLLDGVFLSPLLFLNRYVLLGVKDLSGSLLLTLPLLFYKPLMEASYGGTWGKLLCGVKVVNARNARIGVLAAYVRFLPWLLVIATGVMTNFWLFDQPPFKKAGFTEHRELLRTSPYLWATTLTSLILIVDCLIALLNAHKRAGHDWIAGTYCVTEALQKLPRRPFPGAEPPDERLQSKEDAFRERE